MTTQNPPPIALFPGRTLRIKLWNADARIVDSDRAALEQHVKRLGDVKIDTLRTLDAPDFHPIDLLLIAAQRLPIEDFPKWLGGIRKRFQTPEKIWVPALILADVPFEVLSELMVEAIRDNWYFDILAPSHLSSLPIRVANLLRINDHLHELDRYGAAVEEVTSKVKDLEARLKALTP